MATSGQISDRLFKRSIELIPGGVNSPVRAFKSVGGTPPFIKQGRGSKITDVDDNEYIDYVCSWGPLILGHAHPEVISAVSQAIENGLSFGAPCPQELELSELIINAVPSIEMVRLVNSGTEATMSALRLARAFTGRDKIVKFSGCYHGHSDGLLVKAGSGVVTAGLPDSPGVPQGYTENTLIATYNDFQSVNELFDRFPSDIAAVIIEPVAANMGLVKPAPGFLEGLRQITSRNGALLIFDEVISGFRLSYGGAQKLLGVIPDITCLGKIIGGGLPVGAYGGRRDIMRLIAPSGPVYQAGTLSGNPVAASAGLATLKLLNKPGIYEKLEQTAAKLESGLLDIMSRLGLQWKPVRACSLLTLFFTKEAVNTFNDAVKSDVTTFRHFHNHLLKHGIYWPPSQFEVAFISLAHTNNDIDLTLEVAEEALKCNDVVQNL